MELTPGIEAHREVLDAARTALGSLASVLHQAQGSELGTILTELDDLVASASGVRAEAVLEAHRRGEIVAAAATTSGWVREHCPSLRQSGAGQVAKIIDEVARIPGISAGVDYTDENAAFDRETPTAIVWDSVRRGQTAPALGLACLREMDKHGHRFYENAIPDVTRGLLEVGVSYGQSTMRRLKVEMLARWGRAGEDEVEKEQKHLRRATFLTSGDVESGDLTMYRLGLTPEQAAQLEAALGPLAKPRPNEETGERDLRSNGQRRAEGLVELATRNARVDAEARGGPAESDACVQVTVSLEDLREHKGAGHVLHSRADGTLIGIETLRRMCCDADLIPIVLGTNSETVDVGMTKRLFTRAQRRLLWRRDRHCTFPGCTAPAAWTRAHHVLHWVDGGPTDLSNAALLCQRHHTIVHDRRHAADVRRTPDEHGRYVVWDLAPGSYDRALREHRERRREKPAA